MLSVKAALIILGSQLALGWPQPLRARILERQTEIQDEYDYIIVGGGTSGLTVGDRLTENGECRTRSSTMLAALTFLKIPYS
jgi:hypothetical protein